MFYIGAGPRLRLATYLLTSRPRWQVKSHMSFSRTEEPLAHESALPARAFKIDRRRISAPGFEVSRRSRDEADMVHSIMPSAEEHERSGDRAGFIVLETVKKLLRFQVFVPF